MQVGITAWIWISFHITLSLGSFTAFGAMITFSARNKDLFRSLRYVSLPAVFPNVIRIQDITAFAEKVLPVATPIHFEHLRKSDWFSRIKVIACPVLRTFSASSMKKKRESPVFLSRFFCNLCTFEHFFHAPFASRELLLALHSRAFFSNPTVTLDGNSTETCLPMVAEACGLYEGNKTQSNVRKEIYEWLDSVM